MLISYTRKFIFIHIYKTAGMSIRKSLGSYELFPRIDILNRLSNRLLYGSYSRHLKAEEIKHIVPERMFNEFYKFAFVRNPWDWQVSLYHYMRQNSKHFQTDLAKNFESFDDYIHWRVECEPRHQVDFLVDSNGTCIVDYIGRLETISSDLRKIHNRLNLKDINLPEVNKCIRGDYRNYYNAKTKKLVLDTFQKDISFLGYDFDSFDHKPILDTIE